MDRLTPKHVPIYETDERREQLWERCLQNDQPVIAIRDGTRGYIVRYDLGHLGGELDRETVQQIRRLVRERRPYPTSSAAQFPTGADPLSATEGLGGEAGPISGALHMETEQEARAVASRLSELLFKQQ